jgi:thiamine pyrophosphokinase
LRAIIFANGGFTAPPELLPSDLIIAADGGGRHCLALGLTPHLVVGDFDSLDADQLALLRQAGAELIRYSTHKDYTDLELALQHARQRGAEQVLVLAALGGRWDQTLANVLLPAANQFADLPIHLLDGNQEISLIHAGQTHLLQGSPGDTLSLIPLMGDALGVTTYGLEYPLQGETLSFGSTRGVSNVLLGEQARVSLEAGLLLCVVIHME